MKTMMSESPGIYGNVPFIEYKIIPAISNSYLSRLDKCPARTKVEQEDTPSLLLGRAVHKLVLEGENQFKTEFAPLPNVDKRTKNGKEIITSFQEANKDRQLLAPDVFIKSWKIREAVLTHPFASKLLIEGVTEQTVIWREAATNELCKCRPDMLPDAGKRTLIDLKTTKDASEKGFTRSIMQYGYARQAAFYLDAMNFFKPIGSTFYDSFVFIAVETEEPYRVEVYTLSDGFINYGRNDYKRLLTLELECRKNNYWPHYSNEGVTQLELPAWA